jgi:hypothetical protein
MTTPDPIMSLWGRVCHTHGTTTKVTLMKVKIVKKIEKPLIGKSGKETKQTEIVEDVKFVHFVDFNEPGGWKDHGYEIVGEMRMDFRKQKFRSDDD